ncbi:hypothetical protein [Granulosicoccus antarcticus]|uniref:Uncharacterized protein n=1 Tax=Granulosicoccus antarcticus IMCC3135 TaxID=1192854 RepID=A0A2Z2NQZ0_9GAMM|nr:hypothetical protein [Granulosicoccus antarcticus]ASJ72128.1 hypothetical protein IMCC3135_10170 [Granulosicoccus antarcticus IMCC3135]
MAKRTDRFESAILESLNRLVESSNPITKIAVIENARFKNGRSVGKSTLYSKKNGQLVHPELNRKIEAIIEGRRKKTRRVTRSDSVVRLKRAMGELRSENSRLVDTIVSQEARLQEALRRASHDSTARSSYESDIYLLAKIVDLLTSGALDEVSKTVRRFESRESDNVILKELEAEVEDCMARVSSSKVTPVIQTTVYKNGIVR